MGRMGVGGIHYRTRALIDEAPAPPPAVLWEPSPANPVDVGAPRSRTHNRRRLSARTPAQRRNFLGRFWWKVSKFCEDYDRQELDAAAKRLRVQGGVDISVLRPTLIGLLAGPIAEHRITNGHVVRTRNDSNTAKILLDTTLSSEQRRNLSNECFAEARRIIDDFWGASSFWRYA
jgi:hypothetical protein